MGIQNKHRSGLTRTELTNLVTNAVNQAVDRELEPLKQKQTNWFEQIQATNTNRYGASHIKDGPGMDVAKMLRAIGVGKGDAEKAYKFAKATYGADDRCTKSLLAGDAVSGGFLVPDDLVDEIIELLRPKSLIRRMGPRSIRPKAGSQNIPRLSVSATTSYVAEGAPIAASSPQFDEVKISPKKLASIVNVSNELLAYGQDTESIVRDDLVKSIATTEDFELLRGDGLLSKPKGIRNWAAAGNVIAAGATSLTQATSDLFQLLNALEGADAPMGYAWLVSPRSKNYLLSVRDVNGVPGFNFGSDGPEGLSLYSHPMLTSNQIPNTLGGGSDSEVFLVSPSEVILAELPGMTIDVSNQGAYIEGGELRSAFERDTTLIRVTMKHDIAMRHSVSIAYLTGVGWVAA